MTERDTLTLDLLQERLSSAKIGVLVKGVQCNDPVAIIHALAGLVDKQLYAAIVGYGITSSEDDLSILSPNIEDAVLWRSNPSLAGRIVVFVKEDAEKLHSLAELDTVTMRDLTNALIDIEKKASSNVPTTKFWEALKGQTSYHKYESVEQFVKEVHRLAPSSSAIPSSMWCLNLLRDDSILNDKTNPEIALAENRHLLADAGQLSAEAGKRLSSWLTHAKATEKAELQEKYNYLQRYIEFGDKQYLQQLDFATVKKFLSVSKKPEVITPPTPNPPEPEPPVKNHSTRTREIDGDVIEALFNGDEERLHAIKELFKTAEEMMIPEEGNSEGSFVAEGGFYDGYEIECPKNNTPLRKLVGEVCTETSWGAVIQTESTVLKDAIVADNKVIHAINPTIDDGITSFDSKSLFDFMAAVDDLGLDAHLPFQPIITKLIDYRCKLLKHIDAIMYLPIWAFGSDEELCKDLFSYVELWSDLFSACKNNYSALKEKSSLGSKTIAKAIVLLDTLFVQTPQEWKAILLPINPLYLWRFYEILKTAKKTTRKKFNQEDIHDIKESISRLPQVVNVVIANSLITGGENKVLPNSGVIESLPTFENKVNRYIGSDGIQEFSEILERWVGFSPFSQNELRICAVDVPDFTAFLRSINSFMDKPSGHGRIIIDAFMTRNQNFNNELSKLDYEGRDFEIAEYIKNGRLEIILHSVSGPSEIKKALEEKPVHIAIYFDQSKYTVQYEPSHKNLYVTPLVVTYDYHYDSVTHRGTIAPSSDATSGIIGDYHRILEHADIVETDMNAQMSYSETEDIADIISTIQEHLTQWLVIADRNTECFEPPFSIPIGEQQTEKRMINTWAAADSRIISQYVSLLCNYNLYPQKDTLYDILRKFGHIASNGLISIPKFGADSKAVEYEKKGLIGTLFAAVKYTQDYKNQIPLIASLDTGNAKRWLRNSKFGNERADLIGMRYDKASDTLFVDAIEVKTRDNSADVIYNPDGTLSGHAAEQISTIVSVLNEIFGKTDDPAEDMFVSARREVLKFQMVSECFRKTHAPDSQEIWEKVFRRAFSSRPSIQVEISGILYHFDLSISSGGNVKEYCFSGDPSCKINFFTLSTKEIQKEIFDHDAAVVDAHNPHDSTESNDSSTVEFIDSSDSGENYDEPLEEGNDSPTVSTPVTQPEPGPTQIKAVPKISDSHAKPVAPVKPDKKHFGEDTRLLIGVDPSTDERYYWEFGNKNLGNRHLLINGNSGYGKTYCIQGLLMEAVSCGVSAVVFDYTGGFTNSKLDPIFKAKLGDKITQRIVKTTKVPINPFEKHDNVIDEDTVIPEDNVDVASKISSIFTKVYTLGDQQRSAVYSSVMNGLRKYGDNMSFRAMASELEDIGTGPAKSVLSKIQAFIDMDPFDTSSSMNWGDIRESGGSVYVIQLAGFERDVQILLTELLLWDIWSFCVKSGNEEKPFIIVMDEAQNLDHGEKSPSAKILTEGRKFGISGWYATQFMKPQLTEDEIQRLQQAGQKLYFCPPDDGVTTIARNIDISPQGVKDWAERLKKLKKGECVTCGNMVRNGRWTRYNPRIIKISALSDREV